jgi:glycosyltransferase involved in cell wall biosynthesis
MKVCFVAENFAGGGAERVVSLVAGSLSQRGYDVTIITDIYSAFAYQISQNIRLLPLYSEHESKKNNYCKLYYSIKNIRKIVNNNSFDIIIAIMPSISLSVWFATLGIQIPKIASDHTAFNRKLPKQIQLIRKFIYPRYDAVTILTQADFDYLGDKLPKKVVMPNPLAFEPTINPPKKNVILGAGRLDVWHVKGFDILIKAWGIIADKYPDWTLEIAGEGSDISLSKLNTFVKGAGIEGRVKFIGFQRHIDDIMKYSSIYVLSSRVEGFALTLLEAMSQSCACIAFDCNGRQREIVSNGIDGIIVDKQDEFLLSEEIEKLINDPSKREFLSKQAAQKSSQFSLSSIINRWSSLIERIYNEYGYSKD